MFGVCGVFLRCADALIAYHVCSVRCFFFLMMRRPPRSTLDRSSAASDVYKRQQSDRLPAVMRRALYGQTLYTTLAVYPTLMLDLGPVSYTHLRAHETVLDLVCRLLLEKKKKYQRYRSHVSWTFLNLNM